MSAPEIPIDVDPATGIWRTDGMPMIYMPRHFFINNHRAVETALGADNYARLLFDAGHASAWAWCDAEARTHGLAGLDVFRHYLRRLSQRGWARFTIEDVADDGASARVRVEHSVFVLGSASSAAGRLCYMFAGWFPGALEWLRRQWGLAGTLRSAETYCAGEGRHDHCRFDIALEP